MLFSSSRCPLWALVIWCRTLRHGLAAGLDPTRLFEQQSRSGPAVLRGVAADIAQRLEQGESLADALAVHEARFPPLFLELIRIGEKTGHLEETFQVLEEYYDEMHSIQRQFRSAMIYPVLMYLIATGVITLLILILGYLAGQGRAATTDPLGVGLSGTGGAITFALVALGIPGVAVVALKWLTEQVHWRRQLEALLLMLPGWGRAFLALAVQRCAVALRMGYTAGLSVPKVVRHALEATSNAAFTRGLARAVTLVKKGRPLAEALEASGAPFPHEFQEYVRLGEETGNLPEIMQRVARNYADEAARQMQQAARLTAWLIYALVALLIIVAIFKIASIYLQALGQATG
ncbi:MAG: type II secretion system F family protein [Gemmataceae bacterium]|nr:type II secretion system F family protein [Gemmataceae bacterium]MDW8243242.1 type II secretion system F family protein [Thermogemmata sp.]